MKKRLEVLLPYSIQKDVDIQTEISTGTPAGQIADYAKRLNADLIVLGVRNHPKLN